MKFRTLTEEPEPITNGIDLAPRFGHDQLVALGDGLPRGAGRHPPDSLREPPLHVTQGLGDAPGSTEKYIAGCIARSTVVATGWGVASVRLTGEVRGAKLARSVDRVE